MKTFINFRPTTPLHYAKERWCGYLKPHSKLNTHISAEEALEKIDSIANGDIYGKGTLDFEGMPGT